ncbi:transketolase [Methanoregula sp.]|uniref:transketolase n=1 Tax=Methanoregula sp. TaxID=2052170 RepID=UPI003BB1FFB2
MTETNSHSKLKTNKDLMDISRKMRGEIVEMSHTADAMHLGSSLSCVDIFVALYYGGCLNIDPKNASLPTRDRVLLSKGHASMTLYKILAEKGFFPKSLLKTFNKSGSHLTEHPNLGALPGVEMTAGSLGHGLSVGLGMALAGRIRSVPYNVFVIMSDGECNEGSVWEAAMLAPAQKADNLVAIIDFNRWQATGRSEKIMALNPLKEKWESFGWSAYDIDGHDIGSLIKILSAVPDGSGKPMAIIAHTIKGKGVSFMEDDNNWHYRIPNAEEVKKAKGELKVP